MSLKPLSESDLYNRRRESRSLVYEQRFCGFCFEVLPANEQFVFVDGRSFHQKCFKCAQCFLPLLDCTYYNVEGRFYCEYDFCQHYAPVCQKCKKCVLGKVLRTVKGHYHRECLSCDECGGSIVGHLYFDMMKNLCQQCYRSKERPVMCVKCHIPILPEELLVYRHENWHAYHFECVQCGVELDSNAQVWRDRIYCQRCYDRHLMHTCNHCHKVIDFQQERGIQVDDKFFHVSHFFCQKCSQPITNAKYLKIGDTIYCSGCFVKEAPHRCHICQSASEKMITFCNNDYCPGCFKCVHCQKLLTVKKKFVNIDNQPMCTKCLDRLPDNLRKSILQHSKESKTTTVS